MDYDVQDWQLHPLDANPEITKRTGGLTHDRDIQTQQARSVHQPECYRVHKGYMQL